MDKDKFLAALAALELATYDEAAAALGVGRRSLIRYGTGVLPVPPVLERLLTTWMKLGVPKEWKNG